MASPQSDLISAQSPSLCPLPRTRWLMFASQRKTFGRILLLLWNATPTAAVFGWDVSRLLIESYCNFTLQSIAKSSFSLCSLSSNITHQLTVTSAETSLTVAVSLHSHLLASATPFLDRDIVKSDITKENNRHRTVFPYFWLSPSTSAHTSCQFYCSGSSTSFSIGEALWRKFTGNL